MVKKLLFTILIAFAVFAPKVILAAQVTPLSPIAKMTVVFSFAESTNTFITIDHNAISRISVNMRELVAVGQVVVDGDPSALDSVKLEYSISGSPDVYVTSATFALVDGTTNTYSFVTYPTIINEGGQGDERTVTYKIIAEAVNGAIGYFPSTSTSITAGLFVSTEGFVTASSGGVITLESGNQTKGNTTMVFTPGSLVMDHTFSIEEIYKADAVTIAQSTGVVIMYNFQADPTASMAAITNGGTPPIATLYYGNLIDSKDENKMVVMYSKDGGATWEVVSNPTIYKNKKTVSVYMPDFGYYAIFAKAAPATNNDYRPKRRAVRPGETMEFRNLQPGDMVRIYNLRGKEISRITGQGTVFNWNVRRSDGAYAESGSYIYQIILKDGKVISGSIVVVR